MKVLRLELHYLLAEDFTGGLAAALRDLAAFVEAETPPLSPQCANYGATWDAFRWNLHNVKARFTGKTQLAHLDGDWRVLEQGIVGALVDEGAGAAWIK